MTTNKLAIIGGSGLYDVEEFKERELVYHLIHGPKVTWVTSNHLHIFHLIAVCNDKCISKTTTRISWVWL